VKPLASRRDSGICNVYSLVPRVSALGEEKPLVKDSRVIVASLTIRVGVAAPIQIPS
jgi:hypothetical protein